MYYLESIPEDDVFISEHIPICGNLNLIFQRKRLTKRTLRRHRRNKIR